MDRLSEDAEVVEYACAVANGDVIAPVVIPHDSIAASLDILQRLHGTRGE